MSTEYQQNGTDDETSSEKVKRGGVGPSVLTHGLQHLQHFPSGDAPVRHMTHGEGPAAAVLSLHGGGVARAYRPEDGRLRAALRPPVDFAGLTGTGLAGRVAGWGPGARLALLDGELRPLARAADPPDVRACRASERTLELVTAGEGNVCVWCLHHLLCKVRVLEGLGPRDVFTLLALAPPAAGRHHRAYAACGTAVALVDLTEGRLLERRRSLHLREITSMVHCPLLDCLVTASRDTSIRVWGPDWALLIAFVSHTDVVTSLTSCPLSGLIISASLDGTLRCWSLEEGDQVQMVHVEGGAPPLGLGGPGAGGTFYSFSERGVDFWGMNSLCHLHCRLGADGHHSGHRGGPLRQVVVPPSPPPFPPRALCVSGGGSLALVAVETGAVLSSFAPGAGRRVRGADYCPHRETLLVLTEEGAVLRASALTNPAAALDDWRGAWEEPWPEGKHVGGDGDGRQPPRPGPASCLALYSAVTDHKEALEDWQALRGLEDLRAVKRRSRLDARNWFLVMLGQERGCVSVLKWNSGEVLHRAPAHSGQNVTALLADPGNGYLFSAGEDRTVQVWKVCPLAPDCLSPHLSLPCGQPPVRLTSLGPLLALALQEPHSATYCLLHVCLETQSTTEHPPSQDHLDCITGLCACPQLGVLASSSRDGTIRIWDDENRLLRILQLNAEPECLAYCRQSGDLLLGIRGDLYRIPKTQLLPCRPYLTGTGDLLLDRGTYR
ncbi:WD repeat-containing protein 97-like [Anguilla rostrata]|uniref:WD repeat-containing protein 97-like n=1 Tax=Anguilla rostrata TaxID=7938 RepID=UPI0030CF493C